MPITKRITEHSPDATIIEGFVHKPGRHCSSTALADLLRFHGLDLPEGVLFGLAAGACFYYVQLPGGTPSRLISGRAARLEYQFVELTGDLLQLQTDRNAEQSWEIAKQCLDSGRPAILLTDLYYLDHYDNSAHFPGHAVVLVGYDSELAYLADTDFEQLVATPLESLSAARHSQVPPFPLSGELLSVSDVSQVRSLKQHLPELVEKAVARAVRDMLEPEFGDVQGVSALKKLAQEVEQWPSEADDWQWCARFAYQVIERRGTGGGSFRLLYAEFLQFAADQGLGRHFSVAAQRCAQVAEQWTHLSNVFREASKADPTTDQWAQLSRLSAIVADKEEQLWNGLAA